MGAVSENLKVQIGEMADEKAAAMAIISAQEEEITELQAKLAERS
jgi:hypothetical protein